MRGGAHNGDVEVEANVNIAEALCNDAVVETWLICTSIVVIDAGSLRWRDGEEIAGNRT